MGDRRGCGGSRGRDRHGRGGGDDRQDGFLTSATEAGGEHLETQRGQPALTRCRERNLTALATRDDLRDVFAAVLADQLADFDLRIARWGSLPSR